MVQRLPTMLETQVQPLGQEDLLEKEMVLLLKITVCFMYFWALFLSSCVFLIVLSS